MSAAVWSEWRNYLDYSELMAESLRNNLIQACEGERISLHCPRNTHIVVENSFYGRLVPSEELCPTLRTAAHRPLDNSTGEERVSHDEDIGCAFTMAHSVGRSVC